MATDPPADLTLSPINGEPGTIADWVTTFQLAAVILDPFTNESAWLIETAGRLLTHFREADCRVAFIVTGTADEARSFLGPWADKVLTFADPGRATVKGARAQRAPRLRAGPRRSPRRGRRRGLGPGGVAPGGAVAGRQHELVGPARPRAGDPSPYAGSAAAG